MDKQPDLTAEENALPVEKERSEFHHLLALNPNYFGNLSDSPYQSIKKIIGNTKYEELKCIGFNPNLNQLEATVHIKLPVGFGSGLCQAGSMEYVRFFLDYGSGWQDAGMVAVNVHNIPNTLDCAIQRDKPLVYVLTQPIEPVRDSCGHPILPKVRGILSWNSPPPANAANWPPVWGSVLERHIQIKPRPRFIVDLVEALGIDPKIKLPPELELIKLEPIPLPGPPPFELKELVQLYSQEEKGIKGMVRVEPHRFAYPAVQSVLAGGLIDQQLLSAKIVEFKELGLNWAEIVAALDKTKGIVSYEELNCLGLDYNRDWLVGTFVVKQPAGFSGNLCSQGSKEYVAFWADWDNSCKWTYVGTATVPVHDINGMPADGLHYSAILPVDLSAHRQNCEKPKIVRLRAVLSWNTPPSLTDPEAIPYWGNRIDSHVQIKPGDLFGIKPLISILGGVGISNIDTVTTGMTKPNAKFALWDTYTDPWDSTRSCPFGGLITAQAPPIAGHKYQIWVQNITAGSPPMQLTDSVWVTDQDGNGSNHLSTAGMFDYLPTSLNVGSMLYNRWVPGGDDQWQMCLKLYTGTSAYLGSTAWHRIQLDNSAPSTVSAPPALDLHIDSGGDCKDFTVGMVINGHFVARDSHFGHYALVTLPASMSPNQPVPASGNNQTAVSPGNAWSLNTAGMLPCGYVVVLQVWDRSIVNSVPGQHNYNQDDVGFCLRAK